MAGYYNNPYNNPYNPYIEDAGSELSSGISRSRTTRSGINHSDINQPSDTIRKGDAPMPHSDIAAPPPMPYVESPAPPPVLHPYSSAPPPMGHPPPRGHPYSSAMPPPDVEYAGPGSPLVFPVSPIPYPILPRNNSERSSRRNTTQSRPVYVEVPHSHSRSYTRQRGSSNNYTGGDSVARHLARSVLCMTTDDFSLAGEELWSPDHILDLRLPEAERTFEHPGCPKESDFDAIRINSWPVLRALARLPTIAATVTPKSVPHVFWEPFLPLTENLSQLEKYLMDLKDQLAKKQVALPL